MWLRFLGCNARECGIFLEGRTSDETAAATATGAAAARRSRVSRATCLARLLGAGEHRDGDGGARERLRAPRWPIPPRVDRRSPAPKRPTITVVPTLNEAGNVRRAVESARACASTRPRPRGYRGRRRQRGRHRRGGASAGAAVLSAPRGRASQCNAGARAARGRHTPLPARRLRSRPHTTSTSSARSGTMRRTAGDAGGARSGVRSTAARRRRPRWRLERARRRRLCTTWCAYCPGPVGGY